jgi:hypothetical protein
LRPSARGCTKDDVRPTGCDRRRDKAGVYELEMIPIAKSKWFAQRSYRLSIGFGCLSCRPINNGLALKQLKRFDEALASHVKELALLAASAAESIRETLIFVELIVGLRR